MNLEKNWVHYLTRPFGIFGASLWAVWYDSEETHGLFGVTMPDGLCIEEHPGVVRRYAIKEQLERFTTAVKKVIIEQPKRCEEILKKGLELNKEAEQILQTKSVTDLSVAVEFMVRLTLYATIFPYFCYAFLNEQKIKNQRLLEVAEKLRAVSYYPRMINEVVIPSSKSRAGQGVEVMTLSEVLERDSSGVKMRRQCQGLGKRFVYQRLDGRETVEYVDSSWEIIQKFEKVSLQDEIRGQSAYEGKVLGTARLVFTDNPNAVTFNKRDVLVAVTTSPNLMPLLQKCSAVVTDEGGITSHAAIISRELKKPCVVGTKFATHILKDGDLVEVDADKGVVKVLKRLK